MSGRKLLTRVTLSGLAAALFVPLGGCTYDYLQHTDRVAYSAGDAVYANLQAETTDPSKRSMYYTKGLGKNGLVIPKPVTTSQTTAVGSTTTTSTTGN